MVGNSDLHRTSDSVYHYTGDDCAEDNEDGKVTADSNDSDKPTELTREDIDKFVQTLMNYEIPIHQCRKCSKTYIMDSYGHHIGECDTCWFSRFPKEQVKEFFRSFFE